jgi:hypothetical protein
VALSLSSLVETESRSGALRNSALSSSLISASITRACTLRWRWWMTSKSHKGYLTQCRRSLDPILRVTVRSSTPKRLDSLFPCCLPGSRWSAPVVARSRRRNSLGALNSNSNAAFSHHSGLSKVEAAPTARAHSGEESFSWRGRKSCSPR